MLVGHALVYELVRLYTYTAPWQNNSVTNMLQALDMYLMLACVFVFACICECLD